MAIYNRIGGYSKIKVDGMPPVERVNLRKVKKAYPAYKLMFDDLLKNKAPYDYTIFFKNLLVKVVQDTNTKNYELAFLDLNKWSIEFLNTSSISSNPIGHFVNYKNDSIYLITYEKKLYNLKNGMLTLITTIGLNSATFAERESRLLCNKDKLYIINNKEIIEYDILKNIQTKIATLNNEISDSCALVTDKSLQILGGNSRKDFREVYDFLTKTWTNKSLGYEINYNPRCTIWDGMLYLKSSPGSERYIKVGEIEGGVVKKVDYKRFYKDTVPNTNSPLLSDKNGLYIIYGNSIDVLATKGIYTEENTFLY